MVRCATELGLGSDCAWVDFVQWPTPSDWDSISYVYDPGGRRIEKKYDGQAVMKYLYDGDQIIAEYDATGALVHKYIYGPGVDQPICMIDAADANATYHYHFDGLGSVIALTNSSGAVANLYEYSIFGETSASDPNHPNRFLFTGREFDSETGLYYYRARYYNPYIGRFLQTDPIGYEGGMGLYAYCRNNPITWTDPFGLKTGPNGPGGGDYDTHPPANEDSWLREARCWDQYREDRRRALNSFLPCMSACGVTSFSVAAMVVCVGAAVTAHIAWVSGPLYVKVVFDACGAGFSIHTFYCAVKCGRRAWAANEAAKRRRDECLAGPT